MSVSIEMMQPGPAGKGKGGRVTYATASAAQRSGVEGGGAALPPPPSSSRGQSQASSLGEEEEEEEISLAAAPPSSSSRGFTRIDLS